MVGRLLTLLAVVVSLVGFIGQEAGWSGWWTEALGRGSYVLVVLAVVAALLATRGRNVLALWLQILAATAALAFEIVALMKYYNEGASPFGGPSLGSALLWAGEAQVFGVAALAFGLTLARRWNTMALAALAAALGMAVGTAIYAITLEATFAGYVWWSVAGIGAFLAAAAAAGLERGGRGALRAPVPSSAGSGSGSDTGVE